MKQIIDKVPFDKEVITFKSLGNDIDPTPRIIDLTFQANSFNKNQEDTLFIFKFSQCFKDFIDREFYQHFGSVVLPFNRVHSQEVSFEHLNQVILQMAARSIMRKIFLINFNLISQIARQSGKELKVLMPMIQDQSITLYCQLKNKTKDPYEAPIVQDLVVNTCWECDAFYIHRFIHQFFVLRLGWYYQPDNLYRHNKLSVPSKCSCCDGNLAFYGPFYGQPLYDINFIPKLKGQMEAELLKQSKPDLLFKQCIEYVSLLNKDFILRSYLLGYDSINIYKTLKIRDPPSGKEIKAAFFSLDYKFVKYATNPNMFKTDASADVVYDIFKYWKMSKCQGDMEMYMRGIEKDTVAHRILSKEIKVKPSFSLQAVRELQNVINEKEKQKNLKSPEGDENQ